jgi:hypothetical protein
MVEVADSTDPNKLPTPSSNGRSFDDDATVYLIDAGERTACPHLKVTFGEFVFNIIIDTGSQVSVLSEETYHKVKFQSETPHELPVQSTVFISAFGNKTSRVKRQALIPFQINGDDFENNFFICPQLACPGLFGADFLYSYKFSIDLGAGRMTRTVLGKDATTIEYPFVREDDPYMSAKIETPTEGVDDEELRVQRIIYDGEILLRPTVEHTSFWYRENRHDWKHNCEPNDNPADIEEAAFSDGTSGEEEIYAWPLVGDTHAGVHREGIHRQGAREDQPIQDAFETEDVINQTVGAMDTLNPGQKTEVEGILRGYQQSFSSIPGLCCDYEYEFEVMDHAPFTTGERPIPFAMREAAREQIEMMLEQQIIEPAASPYVNPLVIVPKANKAPRICLDARRLNSVTVADSERTQPMHELLQQFNGVEFLSSLDLTAAFLQISMKPTCRKYTAFLFEAQQYQFRRMAYGLKNSGCALIRALRRIFGPETHGYLCQYIDDLYIHSESYEQHKQHVEYVLRKLTENGFTLNLNKCKFFMKSIKFLGHIIGSKGVSADPDRVASILTYPVPRNQKHLRQFLGTCNFHHRFIVRYAEYTAPLVSLLKKGVKWKWTKDHDEAFKRVRGAFAASIHLSHQRNDLPYIIYTDASCYAISGVLMQTDEEDRTSIISTASRVLSPAERRYTTCEQELLAVVYALQKFRLFVYGHKIKLNTDNKSLSFLGRCVITSSRVARWMVQIQEYDIDIVHVAGHKNHFADALSRNPAGLTPEQINSLRRPREIMIATINLGLDPSVKRDIKNLPFLQDGDVELRTIRQKVRGGDESLKSRFLIHEGLLYTNDSKDGPHWKVCVPRELDDKIIYYVHLSSGHAGSDKCIRMINGVFHLKNLGRKTRKLLALCDTCQKVKHPNWRYDIESRPHLPERKGQLVSVDFYGPLPQGRGGVRYVFVCLDVFSKFIKLYPLKSATTKACLRRLTDDYIPHVVKPETILSDHGTQYTSNHWVNGLNSVGIQVRFSPIRHPQSNPSERYMREIGKACRIYCEKNHQKWPELIPYIERWLNQTTSDATGFTPHEIMHEGEPPRLFGELLPDSPDGEAEPLTLKEKETKIFARLKERAEKRARRRKRGLRKWNPTVGEAVLVETCHLPDLSRAVTQKFMRPYEGPFWITKVVSPSIFEISDEKKRVRGIFNKRSLKKFRT